MPEAVLLKPSRLALPGVLLERGVPQRVPDQIAHDLAARHPERVRIDWEAPGPAAPDLVRPGDAARPAEAALRLAQIRDAVAKLDPDDEGHFTRAGKPDARALSEVLGWAVSAEERDQALAGPRKAVKITRREVADDEEGAVEV